MANLISFIFRKKYLLILLLILIFATFLRIIHLGTDPIGLNQDEAVNGYDAYALGLTLRDHHGHFLPSLLQSFNDWGSTFLTYFTIPFVKILGLSVKSIRLAVVVLGVGYVWLFYIFLRQIKISQEVALIGAFLLSIEPWSIATSRWALPPSVVPFTLLLFLVTFIWSLKFLQKNIWVYILPAITGAFLAYSYQTQRFFAPVFIFFIAIIFLRKKLSAFFTFLIAFGVAVSPIYLLTFLNYNEINASFQGLSILWRPNPIHAFFVNYINFFLPFWNFQAGDPNIMHHIPGIGSSYDFLSLFFYVGMFLCILGAFGKLKIKNFSREIYLLILSWTFLFPVAASLTFYPTVLRVIHGLPLVTLFFVITLSYINQFIKKEATALFYFVIIVVGLVETSSFMNIYLYDYPKISYQQFQYGIGDFMNYLLSHDQEFDKVVIDQGINQPYIYYLFYSKYNPKNLNYSNPSISSKKYTFGVLPDLSGQNIKKIYSVSFGSTPLYSIYKENRSWYVQKM